MFHCIVLHTTVPYSDTLFYSTLFYSILFYSIILFLVYSIKPMVRSHRIVGMVRSPFAALAGGRSKLRPGLCTRALRLGFDVGFRALGVRV